MLHGDYRYRRLTAAVAVIAAAISGCSPKEAKQSPAASHFMFSGMGEPRQCPARCVSTALAIAREGLGLDPEEQKKQNGDAKEIFGSLEKEGKDVGSIISNVAVAEVIEKLTEGPANPVVLVHKSGHLYVLFGAIQVNDKLLCQVVHGSEPVSLVTKQVLLEGGFLEAWRLEKKRGGGVPIHIGSAVIEIDKLWHNFGETFPDKPLECTFRLKNSGNTMVILDKPVASCQCTVPNIGEKTKLAPGDALNIIIMTKATWSPSLNNSILITLYEKGSGTSRQVRLSLIGSQRESMEVSPLTLNYGMVVQDKPYLRVVSLRERPTDRFVVNGIDSCDLPITYKIEVTKDKYGLATYRIHLQLIASEEAIGIHQGELVLTTDSIVRPKVTIPVEYHIAPAVQVIPSVIAFGTVVVGKARKENVQFISRDGQPLDVHIAKHPTECSIAIDQKRNHTEMIVKIRLKEPGIWQGVIKVRVKSASEEQMIEIRCAAYGQKHR